MKEKLDFYLFLLFSFLVGLVVFFAVHSVLAAVLVFILIASTNGGHSRSFSYGRDFQD